MEPVIISFATTDLDISTNDVNVEINDANEMRIYEKFLVIKCGDGKLGGCFLNESIQAIAQKEN